MNKIFGYTLGIMTAVGGFIDIGDFVFATQAGAKFGYSLLWVVALGTIGIMLYSEMAGRVAAVQGKAVFQLIDEKFGKRYVGLGTLIGSKAVNILTCAAEIGGIAIAIQLLSGLPYALLVVAAAVILALIFWVLPFDGIEKLFGLMGLGLIVFSVGAVMMHPQWGQVAQGLIPSIDSASPLTYLYFVVGILAATFMPYEVYFYASGGIEDKWKPSNLMDNRVNAILGYGLGSLLVMGLIVLSAQVFIPQGIDPQSMAASLLSVVAPLGSLGLAIAIIGLVFAIGGAAMETSLSGAYNLAQYLGWKWGRRNPPAEVPKFSGGWLLIIAAATGVILTGIDPVKLTEYAVIFSVVVMPLTYLPVLLAARDKETMGKHANSRWVDGLAWLYFGIIVVVALAAIPLMVLTNMGQG